jgi:hypothetical protein
MKNADLHMESNTSKSEATLMPLQLQDEVAASNDGKFITNRHVVTEADGRPLQDIKLRVRFGKEHSATVGVSSRDPDLAV